LRFRNVVHFFPLRSALIRDNAALYRLRLFERRGLDRCTVKGRMAPGRPRLSSSHFAVSFLGFFRFPVSLLVIGLELQFCRGMVRQSRRHAVLLFPPSSRFLPRRCLEPSATPSRPLCGAFIRLEFALAGFAFLLFFREAPSLCSTWFTCSCCQSRVGFHCPSLSISCIVYYLSLGRVARLCNTRPTPGFCCHVLLNHLSPLLLS